MNTRELGRSGQSVPMVGLGCMGMSEFYGPSDRSESLATLNHAIDTGMTFWDTADMYGCGENERLVGEALVGRRDQVFLATKFGTVRGDDGSFVGVNGRPDYVHQACDASLGRLGVERIDLYYQHRVDPQVPIEDTVGAMAELVAAGKVRYLGLSEASAETLRRASAVHTITALQSEYSLWSRDIEDRILPTCADLGISLVAYSPLGRGFLSGHITGPDDLAEDDWRRQNPRFVGEAFQHNLTLVKKIREIAEEKGCTPAQLALAWVLMQSPTNLTIPGTRRKHRVDENAGAVDVALSPADLARITAEIPKDFASGLRYPEPAMALLNG